MISELKTKEPDPDAGGFRSYFTRETMGSIFRRLKGERKTSQEFMKELMVVIARCDVNNLKLGSEYLWPYLRQRMWVQLYAAGNGRDAKKNMAPDSMQLGRKQDIPYAFRLRAREEYNAVEIADLTVEPGQSPDFLFLTVPNASEQVTLDSGAIYHRITDPIYEIACKVGNAKKIEILKVKTKALDKSKLYYHPVQHILSPMVTKQGYHQGVEYPKGFLRTLQKKAPSLTYDQKILDQFFDWEMHTRDYYIEILRKFSPKALFMNGFHYQTPLISAAHHLGIATVDIQHGIQVGWNPLYNKWPELPKEGYQGLVDYFFVWGIKEFTSIKKVFKSENHTPVIVGFPWLKRQLELSEPLKPEYVEKFSRYKARIILILQNQVTFPDMFRELLENSPDDCLWIIRHHPKGRRFKAADFRLKNPDNVMFSDYFDNIVLAQLFKHTDIAISEGSTVASEADYAGLYNFIFGVKGKENYVEEIKNGHFFALDNSKQFFTHLRRLDLSARKARANLYLDMDIEKTLKQMLKKS